MCLVKLAPPDNTRPVTSIVVLLVDDGLTATTTRQTTITAASLPPIDPHEYASWASNIGDPDEASASNHYDSSSASAASQPIEYLDFRLFDKFKSHLRSWFHNWTWHPLTRLASCTSQMATTPPSPGGNVELGQDPEQASRLAAPISSHETTSQQSDTNDSSSSSSSLRLSQRTSQAICHNQDRPIERLMWLRLSIDLIFFLGHLFAFISAIDYESLGWLWFQARSLTFQNFQARVLQTRRQPSLKLMKRCPLGSPFALFNRVSEPPKLHHWLAGNAVWSSSASLQRYHSIWANYEPATSSASGWPSGISNAPKSSSSPLTPATLALISVHADKAKEGLAKYSSQQDGGGVGVGVGSMGGRFISSLLGSNMRHYLLIVTLVDFLVGPERHGQLLLWAGGADEDEKASYEPLPGQLWWWWRLARAILGPPEAHCKTGTRRGRSRLSPLVGLGLTLVRSTALSLIQILASPGHLYQLIQVALLMVLDVGDATAPPISSWISLMNSLNILNQMAYFALRAYQVQSSVKLLQEFEGKSNDRSRHRELPCGPLAPECKRYLMMSQMLHLKLSIMTIVIRLDSRIIRESLESTILFSLLVLIFYVMFRFYDEYHSVFLDKQGECSKQTNQV